MTSGFDFWKTLAGLSIFLLGMYFLETSIRQLAGRSFKLFLKKHTSHRLRAVAGGTIVTGILQSSSVVNLMVLAFVSAGIISMQNALAVILGSNLGTTMSSWLIATLGFKLDIENFAFPITGIAGLAMMIIREENKWHQLSRFFLGFGFLFIGLSFIKTGVEHFVSGIDLSLLKKYPLFIYVLAGLLITSLIQSSSATVAIVLAALYTNVITLKMAALIVLGSETGTTIKLLVAAANASAISKRVALGNFLINTSTVIVIFIFLNPLLRFISGTLRITDPLVALVFFQSFINGSSILLFYPFLSGFGNFLNRLFRKAGDVTLFIDKVRFTDKELAFVAFKNETRHFLEHVIGFSLSVFEVYKHPGFTSTDTRDFDRKNIQEKYDNIKDLHGRIHNYYVQLQTQSNLKEDTELIDLYISAVRNGMYAAKSIKDALSDIQQLRNSSNDVKYGFYLEMRQKFEDQLMIMIDLLKSSGPSRKEDLVHIYKLVVNNYSRQLAVLYRSGTTQRLTEIEVSTIINFNREIYTCLKSLIYALKGYLLNAREAGSLDELPGFIR